MARRHDIDDIVRFWYKGKVREGKIQCEALIPFPVYDIVVKDTVILRDIPLQDILEEAVEGNDSALQSSLAR